MKKLGIGLVGYGGIGRVHAMAYRDIGFHYGLPADQFQILGVATSRMETAGAAAEEIGCPMATTDFRDLIRDPRIHVIDCCTPNRFHREVVLAAAEAGKAIYCEKPLAMDAAEAEAMASAVERAGVPSQMTFHFRFFPSIMRAKEIMDSGSLGRIFSFRCRYFRSSYIDPLKPLSWRLQKKMSGGGALFDLGSHGLDLLYHLLGAFREVNANMETLIPMRPLSPGSNEMGRVDVDDYAVLNLRTGDGTPGLLETSRMGTGATNDLVLEIWGEKGALRWSLEHSDYLEFLDLRGSEGAMGSNQGFRRVECTGRYEGQKAPDASQSPGFVRAHAECQYRFLRCVSEGTPASPNLSDGLHIQRVMEAALRSSDQKRWVKLDEVK